MSAKSFAIVKPSTLVMGTLAIAPSFVLAPVFCRDPNFDCASQDCGGAGIVMCELPWGPSYPSGYEITQWGDRPANCVKFTTTQTADCDEEVPEGWDQPWQCSRSGDTCCIMELDENEPAPPGAIDHFPTSWRPCTPITQGEG